jgi:hypothetical protein
MVDRRLGIAIAVVLVAIRLTMAIVTGVESARIPVGSIPPRSVPLTRVARASNGRLAADDVTDLLY